MSLPRPKNFRGIPSHFLSMGKPPPPIPNPWRRKVVQLPNCPWVSWNDINECIAAADEDDRVRAGKASQQRTTTGGTSSINPEFNVLELALDLIEMHAAITPEERMAAALWNLHTYVFDRFDIT